MFYTDIFNTIICADVTSYDINNVTDMSDLPHQTSDTVINFIRLLHRRINWFGCHGVTHRYSGASDYPVHTEEEMVNDERKYCRCN